MTTLRDIVGRIRKGIRPEKKPAETLFQIGDEVEITYKDLPNAPSTHTGTIIDVVHTSNPFVSTDPTETIYQIEFFPHGPGFGWIQYFDEKDVKITKQRLREMRLEELGI